MCISAHRLAMGIPAMVPIMSSQKPKTSIAAFLFFSIIAINVMDRQMMAILGESIKVDLELSDTELGALSGPLFAVFYAVAGIPLALLTDRSDRAKVLGWTTAIAGLFAIVGGFGRSFAGLAISRAAVAIGDAGGPPAIWSLVSTYYPVADRAQRVGAIQLGAPVGAVLAVVMGGVLAAELGWQWGFYVVGAMGIGAGLLALVLVPEPRGHPDHDRIGNALQARSSFQELLGEPAFRWGLAGVGFAGAGMFGLGIWSPTVIQRVFGWDPGQTGIALGAATAVAGFAGTYLGGWLASYWRKRGDLGAEFHVPSIVAFMALPVVSLAPLAPSAITAIALFGTGSFFFLAWNAPSISAFQSIASDSSRALAASMHVFFVNMFGLGIGPLAIGALSEALSPQMGPRGLTLALAIVVGISACSAGICFAVAAHLLRRMAVMEQGEQQHA